MKRGGSIIKHYAFMAVYWMLLAVLLIRLLFYAPQFDFNIGVWFLLIVIVLGNSIRQFKGVFNFCFTKPYLYTYLGLSIIYACIFDILFAIIIFFEYLSIQQFFINIFLTLLGLFLFIIFFITLSISGEVIKRKRKRSDNQLGDIRTNHIKKIATLVICFFLFLMYYIISPFFILPQEIRELNDNINLPFKFGDSMNNFDLSDYEQDWENYSYQLNHKMDNFIIRFEGFPDASNEYKLVSYATSENKFSLFNMHIGEPIKSFDKKIKKKGYKITDISEDSVTYRKGRIIIYIDIDTNDYKMNGHVSRIYIYINNTDWLHKVSFK